MKKLLIVVIILLIILALGQIIYYKTNNTGTSNNDTFLYIMGMTTLYDRYNPKLDLIELGNVFYNFSIVDVPQIYEDIVSRDTRLLERYYEQNSKKLKKMNIYTKEDFIAISKQIQEIYDDNIDAGLYDYNINTEDISYTQGNLISFETEFIYDNLKSLKVTFTISENDDTVKISA